MFLLSLGLWAFLAGVASARTCYNVTVPVAVSARNGNFVFDTPKTNLDATRFALALSRQGRNITEELLDGYNTVSGEYNLATQYCMPDNAVGKDATVQVLTHGIGFDKTYWDLPYNDYNYSYVEYALSRGYHTLSYDRLGVGSSSHGEPKNEIQQFLEVEALAQLIRTLRNGSFPRLKKTPSKVVHVGHSFGSLQTYSLTAKYPYLSDGIVLSGFSLNSSFVSYFWARTTDAGNCEYLFFEPPYFDPKVLAMAEQTKQPVTVGELLTVSSAPAKTDFTGPVLLISGTNDLPFCGGDCLATGGTAASIPAQAKVAFPSAKAWSVYIQPNTGHGLNLHYNATAGYKQIADFLQAHSL
ncbi:uncharacterized protein N7459_005855 [Penicillium hispanicum]|uniref:uncharacterized protein n=1 Tax=Penicillium hispanicum TaxID=1080232 RepID=UPI00254051C6|nr:uncharacterized protein N7459_005855 [Penicillium hispanicum]KAJ5579870.1 hypothetical protein N7459_005855 [Penicillium hispanicum]